MVFWNWVGLYFTLFNNFDNWINNLIDLCIIFFQKAIQVDTKNKYFRDFMTVRSSSQLPSLDFSFWLKRTFVSNNKILYYLQNVMSSLQNILENVDTSGIRENLFRIII